ncbi:hypothetical protein ACLOJK_026337 [Asimina triloba]
MDPVGSFSQEHTWVFPPARLWKASVLDASSLIPTVMPEVIASSKILEGDGGVGSIRLMNFTPDMKEFTSVKDRIDVIDGENYVFKYTIIEGGLIGVKLKSYSFETRFTPTGNGGTKSKVIVDYETLDGQSLTEVEIKMIKGATTSIAKAIEEYLQANPGAYA